MQRLYPRPPDPSVIVAGNLSCRIKAKDQSLACTTDCLALSDFATACCVILARLTRMALCEPNNDATRESATDKKMDKGA